MKKKDRRLRSSLAQDRKPSELRAWQNRLKDLLPLERQRLVTDIKAKRKYHWKDRTFWTLMFDMGGMWLEIYLPSKMTPEEIELRLWKAFGDL